MLVHVLDDWRILGCGSSSLVTAPKGSSASVISISLNRGKDRICNDLLIFMENWMLVKSSEYSFYLS